MIEGCRNIRSSRIGDAVMSLKMEKGVRITGCRWSLEAREHKGTDFLAASTGKVAMPVLGLLIGESNV